jgi:hypothetical protein
MEPAVRGLGRRLEAIARDVIQPAVIGARDPALFDAAVEQ